MKEKDKYKMQFQSEEEMLEKMIEVIKQTTGLELNLETTKELLLEVQKEQLKGLVYKAFMHVNKSDDVVQAVNSEESKIILP